MKTLSNLLMFALMIVTLILLFQDLFIEAGIVAVLYMLQGIKHDIQFNTLQFVAQQGTDLHAHIEKIKTKTEKEES